MWKYLKSKKRTQSYTEEFRREAVKRQYPGATTASVARELGVSAQQICGFKLLPDKQ
ncbi:transposase [Microbulbifer sp. EKSA005]|uniref:transposase n=1 Tax=Microbulbifer sp. EKSA005 TaxID=3243364 RepID=UPI0040411030